MKIWKIGLMKWIVGVGDDFVSCSPGLYTFTSQMKVPCHRLHVSYPSITTAGQGGLLNSVSWCGEVDGMKLTRKSTVFCQRDAHHGP